MALEARADLAVAGQILWQWRVLEPYKQTTGSPQPSHLPLMTPTANELRILNEKTTTRKQMKHLANFIQTQNVVVVF